MEFYVAFVFQLWLFSISNRVTSGYEAKAGIFFATIDKALGHKGIVAFVVPFDAPGMMLGRKEEKLGVRASSTCDIILQDVRVPVANIIGEVGEGFAIAMKQLQVGRIGIASQALGIAQAALDLSVKYASDRRIFGQHLIDIQMIKAKIAKMATDLESARLLSECYSTSMPNWNVAITIIYWIFFFFLYSLEGSHSAGQ